MPIRAKMQAFILAGGLGTRLRSIIPDTPKAMAPIQSKPFLEYQILFLRQYGVSTFVLCVGYRHEHIQAHFKNGEDWGIRIDYSLEDRPLGTGGALKNAERYVNDTFLALNGDSYFELDIEDLCHFHKRHKARHNDLLGTIALTQVPDPRSYGSITINNENRILTFDEKTDDRGAASLINAGIYVLEPEVLSLIPPMQTVSLETEVFPHILGHGASLAAYVPDGAFFDIGTPAGYHRFQSYIQDHQHDHTK